ncbi:MAG TPA: helix-turn-helix domain-containing protein [Spirochaetia bacterium]|nr:helix-turn-helix domain-containing protein [Spirochaetia bacterium]
MGGRESHEGHCQAAVLRLLGDYTTLRIIDFLRFGELRFTQLQRTIGDVNPVTLTSRLKRLEAMKIVERTRATLNRQSVTYKLSARGGRLLPILREIQNFSNG